MNNCPICGSKMHMSGDRDDYTETCSNRCYYYSFAYGATMVSVFDEDFDAYYTDTVEQMKNFDAKIQYTIDYWKTNDRYLMKIMEASL